MYEGLGSIKETVALSPREALDSAAELLVQLGYEVNQRADASITAVRRKREGMFGHSLPNVTVAALPQPEGGVKVELRGTDREGVQERQAEWTRWADSLPKLRMDKRMNDQRQGQRTPKRRRRTEKSLGKTRESSEAKSSLPDGEREDKASDHAYKPETPPETASGGGDSRTSSADPGRWATVASWDQEQRVAAGKQDAEPSEVQENPRGGEIPPNVDEQEGQDNVAKDATFPKVVEAESFRLVNNKGEERAVLGLRDDSPYLELKGTDEDSRVLFQVDPGDGSPQLAMLDDAGEIRLYVGLRSDGSPFLGLMDDAGNIRALLNVSMQATAEGVTPSLTFTDSSGEHRFKILQYEGDEPTMLFMNEQGNTSIILREQDGRPTLGLLDESGTTRGVVQLGLDGSPRLIIQDEHGREIRRLS